MKTAPGLLNFDNTVQLPQQLFADFQIEKIVSAHSIAVLQNPCSEKEILRRQELFALLENETVLSRVKNALSSLVEAERLLVLLGETRIPLEKYHLQARVYYAYILACESLASLSDCGDLLKSVADYFSTAEKQNLISKMRDNHQKINILLDKLHTGLLSFADKNWITPSYDAVGEFDRIVACAQKLGFSILTKKNFRIKVDSSLSDAICRLHMPEITELEALFVQYENVDFYEPLKYISEIKFFLEIHALVQKANRIGIPHCISCVAQEPQYKAKDLYDISLFAKNCDRIIPNDADFSEQTSFFYLTGANGGGKTTYLRAVGINLILFLAGCPVFAKEAAMFPFEFIASHFPKDERFDNMGRLDEEVQRATEMIRIAKNKKAFLFFNESFSGTDDKRGFELLKSYSEKISEEKHFCLYVTHFHEVVNTDYPILSAEIDCIDSNKRTYRIAKSKGNASSYATDILKKYRLDKNSLKVRKENYGNQSFAK